MAVAHCRWQETVALTVAAVLVALCGGCGRETVSPRPDVPAELVEQANAHFDAGRYAQAAEAFRGILQRDPHRLADRKRLAYALAAMGQFDDVDAVLRSAPVEPEPEPSTDAGAQATGPSLEAIQADLLLWRRAFNVYRYYYHEFDPSPQGSFRAAAIRDALEAIDVSALTPQPISRELSWSVDRLLSVLQLWVRWDGVARDVDLYPHRRCVPVLVVREPERLAGRLDVLQTLASSTEGAAWLHPDEDGNWLVHPGPIVPNRLTSDRDSGKPRSTDVMTERIEPGDELRPAWSTVWTWLEENLPGAAVAAIVAVRPERGRLMDRRLALIGRIGDNGMIVEQVAVDGPAAALIEGFGMYRRLLRAKRIVAWSAEELEQLAHAYTAAGLSSMDFHTDAAKRLYADDDADLACLLTYVRRGHRLFEEN